LQENVVRFGPFAMKRKSKLGFKRAAIHGDYCGHDSMILGRTALDPMMHAPR
jgi:hypothetical protein